MFSLMVQEVYAICTTKKMSAVVQSLILMSSICPDALKAKYDIYKIIKRRIWYFTRSFKPRSKFIIFMSFDLIPSQTPKGWETLLVSLPRAIGKSKRPYRTLSNTIPKCTNVSPSVTVHDVVLIANFVTKHSSSKKWVNRFHRPEYSTGSWIVDSKRMKSKINLEEILTQKAKMEEI